MAVFHFMCTKKKNTLLVVVGMIMFFVMFIIVIIILVRCNQFEIDPFKGKQWNHMRYEFFLMICHRALQLY